VGPVGSPLGLFHAENALGSDFAQKYYSRRRASSQEGYPCAAL
jgi:hypothetical protein